MALSTSVPSDPSLQLVEAPLIAAKATSNSSLTDSSEPSGFSQLGLSKKLLMLIGENGYKQPTPIQEQCIPHILAGKDVLGLAQTGTGKTGAFVLPLIDQVDVSLKQPQVLVLAPTRELAQQVTAVWEAFAGAAPGLRVVSLYGGASMHSQLLELRRGAQVVVGTPGRVMDHLRRDTLALESIATVVLDEADEMLNMGFVEDIEWILGKVPSSKQVALFSATMPPRIRSIAAQHLKSPVEVRVKATQTTASTIKQYYWLVSGVNRLDALTRVLEVEDVGGVLIFVRTKATTVEVADALVARGFSAAAINGDMAQPMREQMITKLKAGDLSILVATDVAARGLDVERVGLVVNFELPGNSDTYVHRIGRTGRAGRAGMAISFLSPKDRKYLRRLQDMSKGTIAELTLPTKQQVIAARVGRFKQKVMGLLQKVKDKDFYSGLISELIAEQSVTAEDIAACLIAEALPLQISGRSDEARPESGRERSGRDRGSEGRRDSWRESRSGDDFSDRRDRGSRGQSDWGNDGDRGSRDRSKLSRSSEPGMVRYKIEMGRDDSVTPGAIVGSIADATGLRGSVIGRIEILGSFSLVDLPEDLPKDVYRSFGSIWIQNQKRSLTEWRGSGEGRSSDNRRTDSGRSSRESFARDREGSPRRPDRARQSERSSYAEGRPSRELSRSRSSIGTEKSSSRNEKRRTGADEAPQTGKVKERWSKERKEAAKKLSAGKTKVKKVVAKRDSKRAKAKRA